MDLGLSGKRVLVTGGSRGIGLAAAIAFAAEGCHLHLAARDPARLADARARIRREFPAVEVDVHAGDLADPGRCAALAAACDGVDVLVNNAGAIPGGGLVDVDDATWRAGWELKVFGYVNLTRALYARMRERRSGVIVNVIGSAGERPRANYIAGSTANAGLMAFTRALGAEAADHGVRVVGVNPGKTATERQVDLVRDAARLQFGDPERWPEVLARESAGLAYGRPARAEEVGDVIAFLASPRASYVNATVVTVDGGNSMRRG